MSTRRRLLLLGAVPSLLLLLVAARLLLLAVDDHRGRDALAAGEPRAAVAHLERNRVAAPVERWVAAFGAGTARAAASASGGDADRGDQDDPPDPEDLAAAEAALTDALALVPAGEECRVRLNLALVVEAQGDVAARVGDQGAGRASWTRARGVLAAGGCARPDAPATAVTRTARRADDRLRAKLAASRAAEELAADLPAATPQQRRSAARLTDLAERAARTEREVRDAQRPDPGEGVQW